MTSLKVLIQDVEHARQQFIKEVSHLTHDQIHFKPNLESWSILQNVEHIVRVE